MSEIQENAGKAGQMVSAVSMLAPSQFVINLGDLDADEAHKTVLIAHTAAIFGHVNDIRTSAMNMCVSLYHCQQAYLAAVGKKKGEKSGWIEYSKSNFAHIGLSDGNLRQSIRCGEVLVNSELMSAENIGFVKGLSQSALVALSQSPDIVAEVRDIADGTNEKVTAAQIKDLQQQIEAKERKELELSLALKNAESSSRAANELSDALNERLQQTDDELAKAKTSVATLQKAAQKAVVVEALPNGVHNEEGLLTHTLGEKQNQIAKKEKELGEIDRKIAARAQVADSLAAMTNDAAALVAKYPEALAQSMSAASGDVKPAFMRIAAYLRTFANQIDPQQA